MRYEVKFCKAWQGSWKFDVGHDAMAWQVAQEKIHEHTLAASVDIESIHELDCFDNPIRKLLPGEYNSKERPRAVGKFEDREASWIAYFSNGESSAPFFAKAPEGMSGASYAKDIATQKLLKEYIAKRKPDIGEVTVVEIEQLVKNETAIYQAYFSNGYISAPYTAKLVEGDAETLKIAVLKLKHHAQYNSLDVADLKVVKIIELNENLKFIPNIKRVERHKRRKTKMPERKNRVVFTIDE